MYITGLHPTQFKQDKKMYNSIHEMEKNISFLLKRIKILSIRKFVKFSNIFYAWYTRHFRYTISFYVSLAIPCPCVLYFILLSQCSREYGNVKKIGDKCSFTNTSVLFNVFLFLRICSFVSRFVNLTSIMRLFPSRGFQSV